MENSGKPARDGETLSDEPQPKRKREALKWFKDRHNAPCGDPVCDSVYCYAAQQIAEAAALRAELAELHRAIDTDGSLAELPPSEQREAFLTIAQDGAHALSRSGALVAENERLRAELADANGRLDEAGLSKQEILDAVIELERRDHIMFVRSASRDIRRALDRIDSRIDSEISLRAARAASGKDASHE